MICIKFFDGLFSYIESLIHVLQILQSLLPQILFIVLLLIGLGLYVIIVKQILVLFATILHFLILLDDLLVIIHYTVLLEVPILELFALRILSQRPVFAFHLLVFTFLGSMVCGIVDAIIFQLLSFLIIGYVQILVDIFILDFSFDRGVEVINIAILVHAVLKPFFFPLMFTHLPVFQSSLLHQISCLAIDCVGPQLVLLLRVSSSQGINQIVGLVVGLILISNTSSLRVKDIEFICLNRPNKFIPCNHSFLVHQIVSIDLPNLKLHLAMVCNQMLSDLCLVSFVPASDRANSVFQELRLKVSFEVDI